MLRHARRASLPLLLVLSAVWGCSSSDTIEDGYFDFIISTTSSNPTATTYPCVTATVGTIHLRAINPDAGQQLSNQVIQVHPQPNDAQADRVNFSSFPCQPTQELPRLTVPAGRYQIERLELADWALDDDNDPGTAPELRCFVTLQDVVNCQGGNCAVSPVIEVGTGSPTGITIDFDLTALETLLASGCALVGPGSDQCGNFISIH
jgi:hypothetical protein